MYSLGESTRSVAAKSKILARMKPVVTTRQNLNRRHDTNTTRLLGCIREIISRVVHRERFKIVSSSENKQKRVRAPIASIKPGDFVLSPWRRERRSKLFSKGVASYQIYTFDVLEERTKRAKINLIKRDDILFLIHELQRFSAHDLTDGRTVVVQDLVKEVLIASYSRYN